MRILKLRRKRDLALKAIGRYSGTEVRRKHFADDAPAEAFVVGHEDARHAAIP